MSKILITGGAGFIGSNLTDALLALGHEIVVVDNLYSGKKSYVNPMAKFYELDICSSELNDVFVSEKFDYVFHLAAQIDVRKSVEDMAFDNKVNVLGSINVLENVYKHNIKKIIFASSGGAAYGFPKTIPTPESEFTYPVSPYGINKLSFEKYLNYYYRVFNQNYTSLRLANVYGPRQYKGGEAGVIAIFTSNAVQAKTSHIYGDGLQTRDFVYVDDVVAAFIKAMDSDFIGEVNIGTGVESSLLDLVENIKANLNKEVAIEYQAAKVGEERRSVLDVSLAKDVLDWESNIKLKEGIKRTVKWTLDTNNL